jgi:hypothetical protein
MKKIYKKVIYLEFPDEFAYIEQYIDVERDMKFVNILFEIDNENQGNKVVCSVLELIFRNK